jgi:hypothetical protein
MDGRVEMVQGQAVATLWTKQAWPFNNTGGRI